ncbi:MAG: MiaB/RimO family radical SAM methylthiotransferase [Endomicrobiia bacterium]
MNIFVRTYGCKTNQYESQFIKELGVKNNYFITENYKNADFIIINTCAVTETAQRDIFKFIRRVHRDCQDYKSKKIFVIGCFAEYVKQNNLYEKFFDRLGVGVDITFLSNDEKYNFLPNNQQKPLVEKITTFYGHRRAYVKIQDGCNVFCSYCVVPILRNKMFSKPVEEILEEIKGLEKNGFSEIVLVGTHIGKYFCDKKDLVDISEDILKNTNIKLFFSSLEPNEIDNKFLIFFKNNKDRIFKHLHIPLQSGDNFVLKSMRRNYTTEMYKEKILLLREIEPEIIISTDVIVGYPEETKEMFENTINFIKEIKLNWVHVFPYSPREKTLAYEKYKNFVPKDIKDRVRKLCKLSEELGEKYYKNLCMI